MLTANLFEPSMNNVSKILIVFIATFALNVDGAIAQKKETILIYVSPKIFELPRVKYGIGKLSDALIRNGYKRNLVFEEPTKKAQTVIGIVEHLYEECISCKKISKEGFIISSFTGYNKNIGITVFANDASGFLYGCMALADSINLLGKVPKTINTADSPEMLMRGTCIGMQKPYYLPGRTVYEYPYTPETFPWFYDKQMWVQYLDSLLANRMNSLYLWNGHPFASLVKLKDYPYAVEVSEETFKKNEEIYRFIAEEADKRGIWVIQMFYNIIVSKPFAEYHHIKTQDRNRPIIPLIADYTRKSIAAFVEKYPNVGLMVCLGEAMEGTGNDDIEWFTKTIIPGMKDGLKALGKTEEPPIVLRAHDADAPAVIRASKGLYSNLYTEAKFNGEALTTYEPRGSWAELHRTLAHLGSVQIENVHILANLEPFRYGATDFIQKSVKAMHNIMEAKGLHLYPQASYWDFPYTADSVKASPYDSAARDGRLLQIERDWIWYKAWNRYAWKANRDSMDEVNYWSNLLATRYGCSNQQGTDILEAYNQSGEIAPKLLRRFGITDGNRQTLTLGMLMTQLINPYRYGLFDLLYDAESPVGEKLIEYAEKEWKQEPHIGETPVQIIHEVRAHAKQAVAAINKVRPTSNTEEFERLKNDMLCYEALANHYASKAEAALLILRYKYSNEVKDLEKALPYLERSIASYKQLVELTKGTYRYANSMQTQQRKIPIRGVDGTFKTWAEVLVPFENELAHFRHKIDSLKNNPAKQGNEFTVLKNEYVVLQSTKANRFVIDTNSLPFNDTSLSITAYAKELRNLQGIKLSFQQQILNGTSITFSNSNPVKVLVGFFNKKEKQYLKPPELETDASANDYGQSETKIANGLIIKGLPAINIHTYAFKTGTNTLTLAKGACVLLGFVNDKDTMPLYDAGLLEKGMKKEVDWLFE